jgi:glutamyl-tRNA reductase
MTGREAGLAIAGVSHQTADVTALEAFRFPDEAAFLAAAKKQFGGVLLLQTCNRVEVLVEGDAEDLRDFLAGQGRTDFFLLAGRDALRHLFSLAAGIESMIVGEDQIIGQLKKALTDAEAAGSAGCFVAQCVTKAVHVGIEARKRTRINRGSVSVGSAAVILAESELGSLAGRHILVVGSGEMGLLVAQALAAKQLTAMYVANRTFGRAVQLAEKIGGNAVNFSELYRYIALSDVVISCTAAPHAVIRAGELKAAVHSRPRLPDGSVKPLIIIDIAQPRDVEEAAGEIEGVRLFTIDNLREVNKKNMATRKAEAERASAFVEEELSVFLSRLQRESADDCIAVLHAWAEEVRTRERDRALTRLGACDERTAEILDDLSRVLTKKILADATASIRENAHAGDRAAAEALVAALTRGTGPAKKKGAARK